MELRVINIYQVICYSFAVLAFGVFVVPNMPLTFINCFFALLMCSLVIFLIYTNISLLTTEKRFKQFIRINVIANLLQILSFSIFGFHYAILIGLHAGFFIKLTLGSSFLFNFKIGSIVLELLHNAEEPTVFSINFIPLIICFRLAKIFDAYKAKTRFDIVEGEEINFEVKEDSL